MGIYLLLTGRDAAFEAAPRSTSLRRSRQQVPRQADLYRRAVVGTRKWRGQSQRQQTPSNILTKVRAHLLCCSYESPVIQLIALDQASQEIQILLCLYNFQIGDILELQREVGGSIA